MVEELPVGYYLDNFLYVLDFVSGHYGDILTPAELDYAAGVRRLPLDAQRLYVRLCSRKGPLFRDDKLSYPEIDMPTAIESLLADGYVDNGYDAEPGQLLALLTRPELVNLAGAERKSIPRPILLEQLLVELPADLLREKLAFRVLRPLHLDMLQTCKLLFFGNNHQDFTEFVLRDLGISPFEEYRIHPADRLFDRRELLDETLRLYQVDEMAKVAAESNDAEAILGVAATIGDSMDAALQRRAGKIRNRLARQLERLELHEAALELYSQAGIAPSRERQARILHKRGLTAKAIEHCRAIIDAPEEEAEYEFAAAFARRILPKDDPSRDDFPDLRTGGFCYRDITVTQDEATRVEELARGWFLEQGDDAWYVENALFPGLFGLAFWDIIFMARKGVFFNPFQRGPADLFTPEFKVASESRLNERFEELANPAGFRQRVLDTFNEKYAIANWFVPWQVLNEALLDTVFQRVPVAHILAIFRRLLRDLKRNRSGFPDLIVFPSAGGYLLAEVKGPGDTLQDNQRRWLRFFGEMHIPAEVVAVSWVPQ